jgi:hypothetical protein
LRSLRLGTAGEWAHLIWTLITSRYGPGLSNRGRVRCVYLTIRMGAMVPGDLNSGTKSATIVPKHTVLRYSEVC